MLCVTVHLLYATVAHGDFQPRRSDEHLLRATEEKLGLINHRRLRRSRLGSLHVFRGSDQQARQAIRRLAGVSMCCVTLTASELQKSGRVD